MNGICPSCLTPFSPGPLTIPHILSCKHSLCSACLQHSCILKCPVLSCQAHIPRQSLDMFPVNCYLLGEVMVRQDREKEMDEQPCIDRVVESGATWTNEILFVKKIHPESAQKEVDKSELASTLERSRALLAKFDKTKKQLEAEINSKCYEEAVIQVSSHLDSCHAKLELEGHRVKEVLKEKEDRRMIQAWEMCMKNDLVDIIEKPVDCLNDAQLVIDQNIFSALETHLKIEAALDQFLAPTSKYSKNSQSSFTIIDIEENNVDSSEACTDADQDTSTTIFPLPQTEVVFEELDRVEVIFVDSPSSFYVIRMDDWPLLESLESQLELMDEMTEQHEVAKVGQIVAVLCMGVVTRARVSTVVLETATVTYIDLGGTGQHSLYQLSELSGQLSTLPGLAHHCSLASIYPPGTSWSSQATLALSQATSNTICLLTVQHQTSNYTNPIMVSLYLQPAEGVTRDHKCCLAEYLVYRGMAVLSKEGTGARHKSSYQKGFLKLSSAREGSEHQVIVSYIEDPGLVFVQRLGEKGGYAEYINSLVEEVESSYSGRVAEKGLKVLVPRVGMACVAQLSTDDKHYRALVTAVLGDGKVEIQFVDFGNTEITLERKLFKILDKFLTLPVMATPVCLAGIVSVERSGWGKEATKALRDITSLKVLVMFVDEEKAGDDHCKVVLYERLHDKDVCINAQLVMDGHAVSLTGVCTTLEYQKENMPVAPDVEVVTGEVTGRHVAGQSGDTNVEKVACRVISVQSPSSVFIRQVVDEESFYQLNTDLQSYYNSGPHAADVKLIAGNMCAAYMGGKEGWARAKVNIVKGSKVELKLLDAGRNVILPAESLRSLDIKFRFRNFVDEVYLVNLLPAGGTGTWTSTACEALQEMLEQFDMMVYVEMVGKSCNGTLPVNMFLKVMVGSDSDFIPIDGKLIQAGLAIPEANRKYTRLESVKEGKQASSQFSPLQNVVTNSNIEDLDKSISAKWLSPLPPPGKEFLAVPSHVDWEGNIILCPLIPNQDSIRIVGNVLDSKYQGSLPSLVDRYWQVGQSCISRWDLDGRWYRAVVLGINYDGCTVQFVDYGTVEECKLEDMRKDLFMTEIPIQCFPLQLENIQPVGYKWEQSVLDFLHSTVVDQTLEVVITCIPMDENNNNKSYVGKLTTRAGLDIGHLLVRNGYARVSGSN